MRSQSEQIEATGVPDLKRAALQSKYSKILSETYGLPSEACKDRPSLYFFVTPNPRGGEDPMVHVMWGSSEKEALNRFLFGTKFPKEAVKTINMSPPFPEGMNGWNAEFSLFVQDISYQNILERWAKNAVKKFGSSDQSAS